MFLISGATGNVGGELVRVLAEGGTPVRGLARRRSTSMPAGVEAIVGDLDDPTGLSHALEGVEAMFLLSGYADMPGLLAAVRRAGVEHVVLLSSGAVEGGEITNAITRYNVVSEAAVIDSGVAWTILRPSGFMSNTLRWAGQLRSGDVVREPFVDVAVAAIDPSDIAAVAARALTTGGHHGQVYRLTGPQPLLPADRVRILGEVLGRDLRLEPLSDRAARAQMDGAMPREYVDAFFRYFAAGTYDDSQVRPTVGELTGVQPRTFDHWARAHAAAFEHAPCATTVIDPEGS
jgi:uncharacterized protein YbjT (DUF2867 family)